MTRPREFMTQSGIRAILAGLALSLLAGPGVAQMGHPALPTPTPIHERIEDASRVVRARVLSVAPGRISFDEGLALKGEVSPKFEVKRSPLTPLPLAAGDEAILFLGGARSPYVALDKPSGLVRLVEPEQRVRWTEAILELAKAREDPAALMRLYGGWIDRGPALFRELGAEGMLPLFSAHPELAQSVADRRVKTALDADADPQARLFSARFASASAASVRRLCRGLATNEAPLDPGVLELALRGGGIAGGPEVVALLQRAVRDPEPGVRMSATRGLLAVARTQRDEALAAARFLAENDSRPEIRRQGERVVRDLEGLSAVRARSADR